MLTWKYIDSVGSSTVIGGSASGVSTRRQRRADRQVVDAGDQHDVAGLRRRRPATRSRPANANTCPTLRLRRHLPLGQRAVQHRDLLPGGERAAADAADAEPPDVARVVERARPGTAAAPSTSPTGAGTCARIVSNSGRMSASAPGDGAPSRPRRRASPSRSAPTRRRPGSRAARSVAPSRSNSSNVWLTTHSGRAPGRSTLLTTTIGCRPSFSAFMRDEPRLRHRPLDRVDQQQHAVDHAEHALDLAAEVGVARRVDDVDLGRRRSVIEQFLARIVMPRSRSRSLLSIIRSATCWCLANVPACTSSLSTSVVLPWSTWAMMAMLRRAAGRWSWSWGRGVGTGRGRPRRKTCNYSPIRPRGARIISQNPKLRL